MIQNNKSLICFTILSYIDKGVSFVLPLSVLYFLKDKEIYNSLEYAFSIANIVVYLFTVGSMYSFYGFKESTDRPQFIDEYLSISSVSVIAVGVLSLLFAFIKPEIGKEIGFAVYLLLSARITLLMFINTFSAYCRLTDKPSVILLYSIAINIIIIILLFFFCYFNANLLYSFALPELLLPVLICLCILSCGKCKKVSLSVIIDYYKKSIRFGWPIVFNCILGLGVTNFGKIYAFNYMTADDMYVFSYIMRISLVIGMAHSSIVAFYSKDIYTNKFSLSIGLKYVLFIISSAFISFIFIIALNHFLPQRLPIDLSMFIIFVYNILFYAGSFCESFYGRVNKNKTLLFISLISFFIFAVLILVEETITLLTISLIMLVYAFSRLLLMLLGIKDFRVFIFKKISNLTIL